MKKNKLYQNKLISLALILTIYGISGMTASVSIAAPATPSISTPNAMEKPMVISVWTHMLPESIEGEMFAQSVEAFEQSQNKYTIEYVPIAPETYADRIIGSAQSGSLACVLDFDGPYLYNFAWSGYLQPIDRFVSADLKSDLLPSIIAQGTFNGQLYSVGQFDSGLVIYGNRRYLNEAGIRIPTFEKPWNLTEFEDALMKLTALPEVEYAIDMKTNYGRGEFYTYGFSPILQSFGGDLIDRSSYQHATGVLDSPQSIEAMQHLQSWFEKGWAGKSMIIDDDFYGSKKAALAWVGHWMYKPHAEALGKDLVLLPLPDFGHGSKAAMGSWNWGISSNCPDPTGAWTFIKFLLSPQEMLRMTNESGGPPARKSVLAQSKLYAKSGPVHLIAQQLESERAIPRPITPAYAVISEAFAEAIENIIYGADVKTELHRAAQKIDQDIQDHNGYPIN